MDSGIHHLGTADPDTMAVVQGNTHFAIDLYERLKNTEGNLFYSPYSVSVALAMTLVGARSDTETQMAQALHFDLDQAPLHAALGRLQNTLNSVQQKGYVQLRIANALWPQQAYPLREEFLDMVKKHYGVSLSALDYRDAERARKTINDWVAAETEGKITDLIGPGVLNELTRLVLTNAIYFKGDWAMPFDETRTKEEKFWVTPTVTVDVPTMQQVDKFGYSGWEPGFQILELAYAGDDLSMIVLLPEQVDGITELENALTAENLARWTSHLQQMEVAVHLPRFRVRCQFELVRALTSLGMEDAFGEADFSGMDGTTALYLAAVIHQAFVDVNEEGTEAAAATAAVMAVLSLPPPPPIFRADHPFIFLIRENSTGSILFLGRVSNPETEVD